MQFLTRGQLYRVGFGDITYVRKEFVFYGELYKVLTMELFVVLR
jgi:hypothetical protein